MFLQAVLPTPVEMVEAYRTLSGTGYLAHGEVSPSDKSDRDTIVLVGEQILEFRGVIVVVVVVVAAAVGFSSLRTKCRCKRKWASFCQRKNGTLRASGMAGIVPTPPARKSRA